MSAHEPQSPSNESPCRTPSSTSSRDAIVSGRMAPGTALPSERTLCEMLQGQPRRGPRGAQAPLAGWPHQHPARRRRGVLDFKRTASLDLLSRSSSTTPRGPIDLKVARSVMEMRAALGPDIARLCARRATPAIDARLVDARRGDERGEGTTCRRCRSWRSSSGTCSSAAPTTSPTRLAFNSLRGDLRRPPRGPRRGPRRELRDLGSYRAIADAVRRGDDLSATHVARGLVEGHAGDLPGSRRARDRGRLRGRQRRRNSNATKRRCHRLIRGGPQEATRPSTRTAPPGRNPVAADGLPGLPPLLRPLRC